MNFKMQMLPTPARVSCYYYNNNKHTLHFTLKISQLIRFGAFLLLILSAAWLIFWFPLTDNVIPRQQQQQHGTNNNKNDDIPTTKSPFTDLTCEKNMSVYVYPLPAQFNLELLDHCHNLHIHTDMCPYVANSGLGQPLSHMHSSTASNSWFVTHQFLAEMIFHARVENHQCRTWDPTRATIFYIPYYGGLHTSSKFRERNLTARDELDLSLVDFIQAQPWWQRHNGKDHFMVLGRPVYDYMRKPNAPDYGANSLLKLPAAKNMSVLIIERLPWEPNQHGIPYPSYFHPSTLQEMVTWQNKMRQLERPHLFSFVGAPRRRSDIRNEFIRQCGESTRCMLLNCESKSLDGGGNKCQDPSEVMKVLTESVFCLQAPGDTFTRRSTFDSVLAGCIPVFFSPHTAYTQYAWFLPEERGTYSVYIDPKSIINSSKRIEEELMKITSDKVEMMREEIIALIPSLTYAHPNATDFGFHDAVDVALLSLAKHLDQQNN